MRHRYFIKSNTFVYPHNREVLPRAVVVGKKIGLAVKGYLVAKSHSVRTVGIYVRFKGNTLFGVGIDKLERIFNMYAFIAKSMPNKEGRGIFIYVQLKRKTLYVIFIVIKPSRNVLY